MKNTLENINLNNNSELNPAFLEYVSLKEKEFNGDITFEELVRLLSLEFQQFNSNKILIEDEFDPRKELEKVKSAPWEMRGGELAKYKEKFITQKIALAECRIYLERLIRHSPDIDRKYLDKTIQNFKEKYGFSENQLKIFHDLLDKYQESRKDLKFLRKRFPSDAELFKFVTGIDVSPTEKITIEVDPLNFYFRVPSHTAGEVYTDGRIKGIPDFWKRFKLEGFITTYNRELDKKNYSINAIFLPDDTNIYDERRFSRTLRHEREHATNRILKEYFFSNGTDRYETLNPQFLSNKNEIDIYLNYVYQKILSRTQDELISQIISKTGNEKVFLTDFQGGFLSLLGSVYFNWSSYNYFKDYEIKNKGMFNDLRDEFWRSKLHFLKEQYKKDLEKSAKAFWSLINEGGFSLDQSVALLSDRKLVDWPKEAKRILELQRES